MQTSAHDRLPGLVPGQGTARRRSHGHGLRAEDRAAAQQFAYQQKVAPAVLTGAPVLLPVACTCSFRPYPHVIDERNPDYDRHRGLARGR